MRPNQDHEYLTDLELNQFLVFDHKFGYLRIYQDHPTINKEKKPFKIVVVDNMPKTGLEVIMAHPQMTKRTFPFLVVQANGRVNILRTSGVYNAQTQSQLKGPAPRHEFSNSATSRLLCLRSNQV